MPTTADAQTQSKGRRGDSLELHRSTFQRREIGGRRLEVGFARGWIGQRLDVEYTFRDGLFATMSRRFPRRKKGAGLICRNARRELGTNESCHSPDTAFLARLGIDREPFLDRGYGSV